MRSFVLGNGKSRLNIHPSQLQPFGKIYGCNALYREFEPDYLVAVDPKMIVEIEKTGWQKTHEVWTNPNSKYKPFQGFKYFQPSLGWSSGPTALDMASKAGPNEIFILGFDYVGQQGLVNNVYADTPNYKKYSDPATYFGNWRRQTDQVIKNNRNIKYYRVVLEENYFDPEWDYPNFRHISYQHLTKLLPSWPKIR